MERRVERRERTRTRRVVVWAVIPLLVYGAAALALTWPLARHLTTHAAGAGYSDSYEVIRHGWWAREQILDGRDPFDQPLLVYPDGFRSALMAAQPIQYLEVAALALVVSPLTAFNLALLLTLALNGTSAYWLGLTLADRHIPAALLGGLAFMAFPAMQGRWSVGHLSVLSVWALPVLALSLWRVIRRDAGWPMVALGGAAFALVTLGSVSAIPYVLFPLLALAGTYTLLFWRDRLFRAGRAWHAQPWLRAFALVTLGGLLVLPFYLPLLSGSGQDEIGSIEEPGRVTYSTDLLAYISPSPFGPLADAGLVPGYARDVLATNSAEGAAYLGVIAVGLAAVALWRCPAMRLWGWVGLGAMIFALGAFLKWRDTPVVYRLEDWESLITLPWAAIQKLPFFTETRVPGRMNLVVALAVSALVSAGAGVVLRAIRRQAIAVVVAAALAVGMLVEYQLFWPFLTVDARQPDVWAQMADSEEAGGDDAIRAVFNLPFDNNLAAKTALYQQTLHHQPLIAGFAGRRTPQDPAILHVLSHAALADGWIPAADAPFLLSQAGADRVIVHLADLPFSVPDVSAALGRLRRTLGEPLYEDARWAVFDVPRADVPDGFTLAVAPGSEGWAGPVTAGEFSGAMLSDAGDWYLYAGAEWAGTLTFETRTYGYPRQLRVYLDDHLIGTVIARSDRAAIPLWVEAGFHTLRFEAAGGCDPFPFALGCFGAESQAGCTPRDEPLCISAALGQPQWAVQEAALIPETVQLAEGLRLHGYSYWPAEDARALNVRLFWAAEHALPGQYALFVHVADPQTGEPAALLTDIPAVLTDQWPDGTRWQTNVQVPIPDEVSPGDYVLSVGWFDTNSGERLPVLDDRPWAEANLIRLGDVRVP